MDIDYLTFATPHRCSKVGKRQHTQLHTTAMRYVVRVAMLAVLRLQSLMITSIVESERRDASLTGGRGRDYPVNPSQQAVLQAG